MQKFLGLIAGLIVARHVCTYVRHCKENAPIYMYYVAPETPMMSSVIADCPDLAPPNNLDKSTPMSVVITFPIIAELVHFSGVQRGVRTVRRPRTSTLGGIQGASFCKKNVGKWQKMKRKMSLRGMMQHGRR